MTLGRPGKSFMLRELPCGFLLTWDSSHSCLVHYLDESNFFGVSVHLLDELILFGFHLSKTSFQSGWGKTFLPPTSSIHCQAALLTLFHLCCSPDEMPSIILLSVCRRGTHGNRFSKSRRENGFLLSFLVVLSVRRISVACQLRQASQPGNKTGKFSRHCCFSNRVLPRHVFFLLDVQCRVN